MNPKHPFKWRHFPGDIILLCVRWYLRYPLSYGFGSFNTARRTLRGVEAMNMIRKAQVQGVEKGDITSQVEFVSRIFPVAA